MADGSYAQRAWMAMNDELEDEPFELITSYALLALVKGDQTTLEDVHDAWSLWRWRARPDHPALLPFERLPAEIQELDQPYLDAIVRVAGLLRKEGTSS
jgi:hypothetical protein